MSDKLPAVRVTETIRKLRKAGFIFDRQAKGSDEIWYNPQTQRRLSFLIIQAIFLKVRYARLCSKLG